MTEVNNRELVEKLKEKEVLKTPAIISAFEKIDRMDFVIDFLKDAAYINKPLGIGFGQTISEPLAVAFVLELLQPQKGDKILDIGFGSGWQTSLLAELVGEEGMVCGLEILPEIYEFGKENIDKCENLKSKNVKLFLGDGFDGLPEEAPFDKIVSGAAPEKEVPQAWKDQLKVGGSLVFPMRDDIWIFTKKSESEFEGKNYPGFFFLPLVKKKP